MASRPQFPQQALDQLHGQLRSQTNPQHPMNNLPSELENQIFTALMLLICKEIDPAVLAVMHDLDMADPRMVDHLKQHNQQMYQKLLDKYSPDGSVKPAAPASGERLRLANGRPDFQLESTRAVHKLFTEALSKKGGR